MKKIKPKNPKSKNMPQEIKGLSDRELIKIYESGKIDMKKVVKPLLKPPKS